MKATKRGQELLSSKTVKELVENMFNPNMDDVFRSYPDKRMLVSEWIICKKEGIKCPNFKHNSPIDLAEDIYRKDWDDDTGIFQELRRAFVEWVDNFISTVD